jgi:hypothetical protein
MATLALFFVLGLVRDALGAWYYMAIGSRQNVSASALSGLISAFDLLVIAGIIYGQTVTGALSYACGNALGTLIALKIGTRK